MSLLESNEWLKSAYWQPGSAAPNLYGLPRAYRAADGFAVLRTQRVVLAQPLASPGQVTVLPTGQMFANAVLEPEALLPEPAPQARDAIRPARISLPSVGIEADVIALDMSPDGTLPAPNNGRVAAWYSYGARLGESGNAVLAGHVDWDGHPGAFWRLREVKPDQEVLLHGNEGEVYRYRVEWVRDYPAESLTGLASLRPGGGASTVTLVTCSGRFDAATRSYDNRQVVRATLVAKHVE